MAQSSRPLSPHLSVYRWQITMTLSILQRVTGIGLYFGALLICWFLVAAVLGPEAYDTYLFVAGSWFGKLVYFVFLWAVLLHFLNGLRYMLFDFLVGTDSAARFALSWVAMIGALVLAVIIFALGVF
jgi:succinate dehydrogenase / fumarate reductase cytochrome b subunit